MELPLISVVTPSYNQGEFLEETMLSVLQQDYPKLEYIVIDGGSTDASVSIIEKYASRLAYWESNKDRGFGHAINKGLSRASGEIVCWVNSDDLLLPGALQAVGTYFALHPEVGLVFGDRHIIDTSSKRVAVRAYYFYDQQQFRFGKALPQEATFWRRKVMETTGLLDEDLKFAIDFDLWCRMSKATHIEHIPVFLGAFREQPASKSSTIAHTGLQEKQRIVEKYFGRYPSPREIQTYQFWLGLRRRLYKWSGLYRRHQLKWLERLKRNSA
jgi:glycosyltransferase involved in cell wall biosynthesis